MTPRQQITVTGSSYEILAELSSGGMGNILLARRTGAHGFKKLFAIKTVRAEYRDEPNIKTMFLDEARLVAQL
ncbi:protein kinase, partial [Myxococcota bacterium]